MNNEKTQITICEEEEQQIKECVNTIVSKQLEHDKKQKIPSIFDELFGEEV